MNKKAKQMTNISTYVVILFLLGLLVTGVLYLGNEALANSNANLDNDSISYIANLNGVDTSFWNTTKEEIESPILVNANYSQGNPKDEAIDFLFAKEKGLGLELTIKGIFSMPQLILYDLLRLQRNNWNWIVSVLNWVWRLFLIITLIYFVRGIIDR